MKDPDQNGPDPQHCFLVPIMTYINKKNCNFAEGPFFLFLMHKNQFSHKKTASKCRKMSFSIIAPDRVVDPDSAELIRMFRSRSVIKFRIRIRNRMTKVITPILSFIEINIYRLKLNAVSFF